METIIITLPIDWFIETGINKFENATAVLSRRLTEVMQLPCYVEIGDCFSVQRLDDLEIIQLIILTLQEEQRKLRNSLLDIDERPGKAFLRYIISVHNQEIIDDRTIAEILIFSLTQVCRFMKIPIPVLTERIEEVYAKTKKMIEEES